MAMWGEVDKEFKACSDAVNIMRILNAVRRGENNIMLIRASKKVKLFVKELLVEMGKTVVRVAENEPSTNLTHYRVS